MSALSSTVHRKFSHAPQCFEGDPFTFEEVILSYHHTRESPIMCLESLPHILGRGHTGELTFRAVRFAQPFVNRISHTQPLPMELSTVSTMLCAQTVGSHPCPSTLPSIKADPTPSSFLYSRLQDFGEIIDYLRVFNFTLLLKHQWTLHYHTSAPQVHSQPRPRFHRELKDIAWIMFATSA